MLDSKKLDDLGPSFVAGVFSIIRAESELPGRNARIIAAIKRQYPEKSLDQIVAAIEFLMG